MKDLFSLKGKVIVVTGGAGYLGSVMVRALLEFGGIVAIADIMDKTPIEVLNNSNLVENLL